MNSFFRGKSAEILLLCGLTAMVAVSVQSVMSVRCGQMVFFMILAGLTGRRVRLIPAAVMLFSVVIANLFSPNGRVLFSIWNLDVTYGALRLGLLKGSLLVGLIYVSRVSVGLDLRIPGYFGALLLKAFAYFEVLTEKWPGTRGGLLKRIDDLLMEASEDAGGHTGGGGSEAADDAARASIRESQRKAQPPRTPKQNLIAAAILVIAGWGPYIATNVIG